MLAPNLVVLTLCSLSLFAVQFVFSQRILPDRSITASYPFTSDLDAEGKYVLRWGFNENKTVIRFQVQVQTLGYVGFGFSETGRMAPADVLVVYVTDNLKDNLVYFRDYHTVEYGHPISDASQDWFVDHGYEKDGWTIVEFHRLLDTCDTVGDRAITSDTMRIIYSYSDTDPTDLDSLTYHTKRGFKSLSLLTTSPPPRFLPSDTTTRDFLNENYQIPADTMTTFHCRVFDLSDIKRKHHIIKVSPVLSPTTAHAVDHMVLYRCHVNNPRKLMESGNSFNCFTDAPNHIQFCREHVASFGHGKSDMYLPEDVGIPYGGPRESNVYVLATHYENEEFTPGLIDNSGIRITYTSQLRQNDAGFLSLGNIISPNWLQFIPPGEPDFVQKAYCSMRCLSWGIGGCGGKKESTPMTVVGVQFHSHSLGKAMKLRHMTHVTRNRAQENPWLAYDRSYDSDHQNFRLLETRRNVSCRDALLLECSYDSTEKTQPTVGGWTDYDEICRGYILYYPRKPIEGCMSWSNYDQLADSQGARVNGSDVFSTLVRTNWETDTTMRRNLKYSLDHSMENGQCWSSSPRRKVSYAIDYFRQPFLTRIYSEPQKSTC